MSLKQDVEEPHKGREPRFGPCGYKITFILNKQI